ncbi:unnamed protein product [Didymodactylos carnosus]|uniref:Uncharacterized protein n=1 Tax=Didymodactylos carnosus TaxID=1234261 RepID=A0A8S2JSG8_9BILA|nr:unnamed protein product [Didymodactylos carnosus]CAF3812315.1 unnamed protein product [Didymodactylos carnosus]
MSQVQSKEYLSKDTEPGDDEASDLSTLNTLHLMVEAVNIIHSDEEMTNSLHSEETTRSKSVTTSHEVEYCIGKEENDRELNRMEMSPPNNDSNSIGHSYNAPYLNVYNVSVFNNTGHLGILS